MRRRKGTGSVIENRGKFYARRRKNGEDEYGPARDTRDEAEQDRLDWFESTVKKSEMPRLGPFAFQCMKGAYGKSLAKSTWNKNEGYRVVHLNPHPIADMRIDRLTTINLQDWVDNIRVRKIRKVQGQLVTTYHEPSPRTLAPIFSFVSAVMGEARRLGYIKHNPCADVRLPKIEERDNRTLEAHEAAIFLDATVMIDCMAMLATLCGLRRSEVIHAKHVHFNALTKTLTVHSLKGGKLTTRFVPVPVEAEEVINKQPKRGEYIFSTEKGNAYDPSYISRAFKIRKRKLGLPAETRFQDLRGTFLNLSMEGGGDVRATMEVIGHKRESTTMKAYARGTRDRRIAVTEGVANRIRNQRVSDRGSSSESQDNR